MKNRWEIYCYGRHADIESARLILDAPDGLLSDVCCFPTVIKTSRKVLKMKLFPGLFLSFPALVGFGILLTPAARAGDDWRPVTPEDLAMKTPVVEKGADAEAIFWEIKIDDDQQGLILTHYVRIKIFTDRGKE